MLCTLYHKRSAVPAESRDTVGHTDRQGSILPVYWILLWRVMSTRDGRMGEGLHAAVAGP